MKSNEENTDYNHSNKEEGFRYFKIIVKILNQDLVQHQNLEIYTTGLKRLLEMRRIHNLAFSSPLIEKLCVLNN